MPRSIDIERRNVDKIMFRGRYVRKITRLWCRLKGHKWTAWNFDWPYDVPDSPLSTRDPNPNQDLTWVRGCDRDCGVLETAVTSLHSSGLLPGDVTSLYDNPIRRWMR